MPIQDLFSTQTSQEKLREEKAIVSTVIRYFETAYAQLKPPKEAVKSAHHQCSS